MNQIQSETVTAPGVRDFKAETEASNRRLVAGWMKLEAEDFRLKAKNTRYRFQKSGTLTVYAERYAKLADDAAELFEEDARRLLSDDFKP